MVRKHPQMPPDCSERRLSLPFPGSLDLRHPRSCGIEGLFKPLRVLFQIVELILGGPLGIAHGPKPTPAPPCPSWKACCVVAVPPTSTSAIPETRSWSVVASRRPTLPGTTAPAKPSARHWSHSSRTGSVSTRHVSSSLSEVSSSSQCSCEAGP